MHTRLFPLFFLLACGSSPAATIRLSLQDIPSRVEKHHPGLAAARWSIEEARGRLLGAGRLENPELELNFMHDNRFEEGTVGMSLTQAFPLTSRLRLEKKLTGHQVAAAELEVQDATRQIIAEAQALTVQLLSLDEQRALRKQQLELAQTLSKFASDRAAIGEISALDAAQAQVDSQRLILEGRKLESSRVTLQGQLKPKLGLKPDDVLVVNGSLSSVDLPKESGWQKRPDYQLAQLRQEAAQTGIDLAKARKWQDWKAGIAWEGERAEDAPEGLERTGFFGLQLSIPLPFWNRNQGEIAEKTAGAMRAQLETKALQSEIAHEAGALRDEMRAYAQLARETREQLLPLVVEQSDRIEKAYETGQTDLIDLLRVRDQRLQLEAAVLEALRDFHLARIRYEAATGKHANAPSSK